MWSFPEEVRYTTQYTTRQRLHIILLKVSKYQKHFFLKLHCPKKWTKYLKQIQPYLHRVKFCLIFCLFFWAMEFQEKLLLRFTDYYKDQNSLFTTVWVTISLYFHLKHNSFYKRFWPVMVSIQKIFFGKVLYLKHAIFWNSYLLKSVS